MTTRTKEPVGNFQELKQEPTKQINKLMFMLEELREEINSACDPGHLSNVGVMLTSILWQNAETMLKIQEWLEPFHILVEERKEENAPW